MFFDQNPSGRILNRFTSDIGQIDFLLAFQIFRLLNMTSQICFVFIIAISIHYINGALTLILGLILYMFSAYF